MRLHQSWSATSDVLQALWQIRRASGGENSCRLRFCTCFATVAPSDRMDRGAIRGIALWKLPVLQS